MISAKPNIEAYNTYNPSICKAEERGIDTSSRPAKRIAG